MDVTHKGKSTTNSNRSSTGPDCSWRVGTPEQGWTRGALPRIAAYPCIIRDRTSEMFLQLTELYLWLRKVGGWGSNPRPADYEKYGPVHRTHYLHGYHGAVPPMALIAPFARVTRSTNRSTPHHGDHRMAATERYRRQACLMLWALARCKWVVWSAAKPKIPRSSGP
jgi:hypothetical protein